MAFEYADKKPGDLIRSADWNAVGTEVVRLGIDKISRAGEESLEGPLTVRGTLYVGTGSAGGGLSVKGDLSVGIQNAGAAVRVLKKQEDGKSATDGALVLGTESPASAALRIGYFGTYSWLQGQGQQNIAINPHGGNVGIGTGTTAPTAKLHVEGDLRVTGALGFGNVSRQMVNLWGTGYGIGVQSFTTYLRTDGNFAFYKGGTHDDEELNPGGGTALATLTAGGQLLIGVRTPAAGHPLYVEGGSAVHSGGAGGGYSFANRGSPYTGDGGTGDRWVLYSQDRIARLWSGGDKLTVTANGNVGIGTGTTAPAAKLHVGGDALVTGTLSFGSAVRQMVNLWGTGYGIGVQSFTTYLRTDGNFAFYKGGTHNDGLLDPGGGTALAVLTAAGQLAVGTTRPERTVHVEGHEVHSGGFGAGYSFSNRETSSFVDPGNAGERWVLYSSKRLARLWTGADRFTFDAAGTLTCARLTQTSTREIKRDIAPLDEGYAADLLDGLEPVRYRMIEDPDGDEHLGFVAEEVPDALAGADHRTIHPGYIVAVLTRVVKEQQRRLDELTHRLEQGLSA